MTAAQFDKLSLNEKGGIVFSDSKYLAVRKYYGFTVNLYLFNDFYIEVFYHPVLNKIDRIEVLEDLGKLDLYIDYMNKLNLK